MRYYRIGIWNTEQKGGKRTSLFVPKSMESLQSKKWSYYSVDDDGRVLHSALDIQIDITSYQLGMGREGSSVHITGIGRDDISQFTQLALAEIEVHAGMLDNYLPLSHSVPTDLLMRGTVWWASGNWEGINTTLDLILVPVVGLAPSLADVEAKNMTFNWPVGTKMEDAIKETLDKTYGKSASNPNGYEIKIEISDQLVAQTAMSSFYPNLSAFASGLAAATTPLHFPSVKPVSGARYSGVSIKVFDKTITVYDGTKPVGKWTKQNPMDIPFQDLIGQPVWKNSDTLVFKTIMRGDIEVANWIKLPKWLASPYVLTSAGTQQSPNDPGGLTLASKKSSTFSGGFEVVSVRHIGQFRQPDAQNWVTVIECQAEGSRKKPGEPLKSEPAKADQTPTPTPTYPDPKEAQGGPIPSSNPTNPLNTPPPLSVPGVGSPF